MRISINFFDYTFIYNKNYLSALILKINRFIGSLYSLDLFTLENLELKNRLY